MPNHSIVRLFESRRAHLDDRINRDYIRNDIASIPCRISGYSDVISIYSVKNYETLNSDFVEYLKNMADLTPSEYPIVLSIIGGNLTQEEKKIIEETIREDSAYNLGIVEKDEKRHMRIFYGMFFGLLISGILLWLTRSLVDEARELFFILFWFMGDTVCDYVFLTGYELRKERRLAGRLASIKVVFSDKYEDPDYTKSDVDKLYSEIERDVKATIQEEK